MSDRILVATRKGLFVMERGRAGGWTPTQVHFLGEPVTAVLSDARDGALHAALNLGHFGVKLRRRRAGRQEWEERAVPTYPAQPEPAPGEAPATPWTLVQIWSLEAGGQDEPGVLWAGTIPGGLFRSSDGGDSWELNRPLWDRPERAEWFGGGYDHPGIHSICVDPRDSRHVTVAVSCGGVWQTRDGADSWTCCAQGMHAGYMPPQRQDDPNIQDPHRLAQCAAHPDVLWVQHHDGIFRSVDGAASWKEIANVQPSKFGFAVAAHPRDPDTAWFVAAAKDACRVPVDAQLSVSRTRDGGETFEILRDGLPAPAYDLVYRHGLAVDSTGGLLAMGSTTGGLWVSDNGGDNWRCVSAHLPPIYAVRFA